MTTLTLKGHVPTQERKACPLVPLDHVRNPPCLRAMATSAVFTKLTLMHICVAGQALRARGSKFQPLVAGGTCESLVAARQGEARRGVSEFCILAHLP